MVQKLFEHVHPQKAILFFKVKKIFPGVNLLSDVSPSWNSSLLSLIIFSISTDKGLVLYPDIKISLGMILGSATLLNGL